MSDFINDGTVQFGSRELTINAVVYETDDFSYDPSVTDFTRTNYKNKPTGQVYVKGKITGKCTVQLPEGSTNKPTFGATFTTSPAPADEAGFIWFITKVGRAERKEGETKVSIEFALQISNTLTVS